MRSGSMIFRAEADRPQHGIVGLPPASVNRRLSENSFGIGLENRLMRARDASDPIVVANGPMNHREVRIGRSASAHAARAAKELLQLSGGDVVAVTDERRRLSVAIARQDVVGRPEAT